MEENILHKVVSGFCIEGDIVDIAPLGGGLINDTYRVCTAGPCPDYVLQRINNSIFKDVDLLQSNIDAVTGHIRSKLTLSGVGDIDRRVKRYIPVRNGGKSYLSDGGNYWRLSIFIDDAETCDTVDPEHSYCAGRAFGNFEAMLADIPCKLGETIPDFHNMELRSAQLKQAVVEDRAGRLSSPECREILEFLNAFDYEMCGAERMYREGLLPKRICHCDSKVNNILFDRNGEVLCVIDLDTVMPSFVFSDFGDFLRTGANTAAEDEPDLSKVSFRMDIFESFARGYLESTSSFLTDIERNNLAFGVLLFPFMQAVRFFTDYLNGDVYYKISYPEHNLVRTRNQITFFRKAREKYEGMADIIEKYK